MVFDKRNSDDRRQYSTATQTKLLLSTKALMMTMVLKDNDDWFLWKELDDFHSLRNVTPNVIPFVTLFFSQQESLGGSQEWKNKVLKGVNVQSWCSEIPCLPSLTKGTVQPNPRADKSMQQFVVDSLVETNKTDINSYDRIKYSYVWSIIEDYRILMADDSVGGLPGRNIILAASYTGSPRDMIAIPGGYVHCCDIRKAWFVYYADMRSAVERNPRISSSDKRSCIDQHYDPSVQTQTWRISRRPFQKA